MNVTPLESISFEQAKQKQFELVEQIRLHFSGHDYLTLGDLGVTPGLNQPKTTNTAEKVVAQFFNAQAAIFVRGAGTGALRSSLFSMIKSGQTILVHTAPIYPTTEVNIKAMGLKVVRADFNNLSELQATLSNHHIDLCLIQHSRQSPEDSYQLSEVIHCVKQAEIPTLIDDNYAVMKVSKIGCELDANLSTFSSFKLFGPQGVGIIVGDKNYVDAIRATNYSGGCQVQGHEALEALRGLTFAPVMHAVQAQVNDELISILNDSVYPYINRAFLANAQSKVLLVELKEDIAEAMIEQAEKLGALPNPVGAESKYEIPPLFYRVSGTFNKSDPSLKNRMIRINPNRAGAQTILNILNESYKLVKAHQLTSEKI